MIRKNMRFKGASAKAGTHHTDKHAARYLRKKPLTPAQQRAQDAHKEHTEAKALTETEEKH